MRSITLDALSLSYHDLLISQFGQTIPIDFTKHPILLQTKSQQQTTLIHLQT
jgi:hypothetical protein